MGLGSEMKDLSENILASFKQRIKENEDLVNDVQNTLDGFRKDHQEMADVLHANANALRNGLAHGEKDRLHNFNELMKGIHHTIGSIQKEVVAIQSSTFNMIKEFNNDRVHMAGELNKFFADDRAERMQNEKHRMEEFNALMKNINDEIKSIDNEVLAIFKSTNDMLLRFEKEHLEMSVELKAELTKNLTERIEYTRELLNGFQKRLSEINKENQNMARQLRNDLDSGEKERLKDYKGLMDEIQTAINGIHTEVKEIKDATTKLIGDFAQDRGMGSSEWSKMQEAISRFKKTTQPKQPREVIAKVGKKKEVKIDMHTESVKKVTVKDEQPVTVFPVETIVEEAKDVPAELHPDMKSKADVPMTLEDKVLAYINKHPMGVKVSEMEEPLGETRMKLGFTAKALLDEGKVQKMDNIYFPIK